MLKLDMPSIDMPSVGSVALLPVRSVSLVKQKEAANRAAVDRYFKVKRLTDEENKQKEEYAEYLNQKAQFEADQAEQLKNGPLFHDYNDPYTLNSTLDFFLNWGTGESFVDRSKQFLEFGANSVWGNLFGFRMNLSDPTEKLFRKTDASSKAALLNAFINIGETIDVLANLVKAPVTAALNVDDRGAFFDRTDDNKKYWAQVADNYKSMVGLGQDKGARKNLDYEFGDSGWWTVPELGLEIVSDPFNLAAAVMSFGGSTVIKGGLTGAKAAGVAALRSTVAGISDDIVEEIASAAVKKAFKGMKTVFKKGVSSGDDFAEALLKGSTSKLEAYRAMRLINQTDAYSEQVDIFLKAFNQSLSDDLVKHTFKGLDNLSAYSKGFNIAHSVEKSAALVGIGFTPILPLWAARKLMKKFDVLADPLQKLMLRTKLTNLDASLNSGLKMSAKMAAFAEASARNFATKYARINRGAISIHKFKELVDSGLLKNFSRDYRAITSAVLEYQTSAIYKEYSQTLAYAVALRNSGNFAESLKVLDNYAAKNLIGIENGSAVLLKGPAKELTDGLYGIVKTTEDALIVMEYINKLLADKLDLFEASGAMSRSQLEGLEKFFELYKKEYAEPVVHKAMGPVGSVEQASDWVPQLNTQDFLSEIVHNLMEAVRGPEEIITVKDALTGLNVRDIDLIYDFLRYVDHPELGKTYREAFDLYLRRTVCKGLDESVYFRTLQDWYTSLNSFYYHLKRTHSHFEGISKFYGDALSGASEIIFKRTASGVQINRLDLIRNLSESTNAQSKLSGKAAKGVPKNFYGFVGDNFEVISKAYDDLFVSGDLHKLLEDLSDYRVADKTAMGYEHSPAYKLVEAASRDPEVYYKVMSVVVERLVGRSAADGTNVLRSIMLLLTDPVIAGQKNADKWAKYFRSTNTPKYFRNNVYSKVQRRPRVKFGKTLKVDPDDLDPVLKEVQDNIDLVEELYRFAESAYNSRMDIHRSLEANRDMVVALHGIASDFDSFDLKQALKRLSSAERSALDTLIKSKGLSKSTTNTAAWYLFLNENATGADVLKFINEYTSAFDEVVSSGYKSIGLDDDIVSKIREISFEKVWAFDDPVKASRNIQEFMFGGVDASGNPKEGFLSNLLHSLDEIVADVSAGGKPPEDVLEILGEIHRILQKCGLGELAGNKLIPPDLLKALQDATDSYGNKLFDASDLAPRDHVFSGEVARLLKEYIDPADPSKKAAKYTLSPGKDLEEYVAYLLYDTRQELMYQVNKLENRVFSYYNSTFLSDPDLVRGFRRGVSAVSSATQESQTLNAAEFYKRSIFKNSVLDPARIPPAGFKGVWNSAFQDPWVGNFFKDTRLGQKMNSLVMSGDYPGLENYFAHVSYVHSAQLARGSWGYVGGTMRSPYEAQLLVRFLHINHEVKAFSKAAGLPYNPRIAYLIFRYELGGALFRERDIQDLVRVLHDTGSSEFTKVSEKIYSSLASDLLGEAFSHSNPIYNRNWGSINHISINGMVDYSKALAPDWVVDRKEAFLRDPRYNIAPPVTREMQIAFGAFRQENVKFVFDLPEGISLEHGKLQKLKLSHNTKTAMLEMALNLDDLPARVAEYNQLIDALDVAFKNQDITHAYNFDQIYTTYIELKRLEALHNFRTDLRAISYPGLGTVDDLVSLKSSKPLDFNAGYTVIDIEATGLQSSDYLTQLSAVRIRGGQIVEEFNSYVKIPKDYDMSRLVKEITGITEETLAKDGREIAQVLQDFKAFLGADSLLAHNADFDVGFLRDWFLKELGEDFAPTYVDSLHVSRKMYPGQQFHSLEEAYARVLKKRPSGLHDSLVDVKCTYELYEGLRKVNGFDAAHSYAGYPKDFPEKLVDHIFEDVLFNYYDSNMYEAMLGTNHSLSYLELILERTHDTLRFDYNMPDRAIISLLNNVKPNVDAVYKKYIESLHALGQPKMAFAPNLMQTAIGMKSTVNELKAIRRELTEGLQSVDARSINRAAAAGALGTTERGVIQLDAEALYIPGLIDSLLDSLEPMSTGMLNQNSKLVSDALFRNRYIFSQTPANGGVAKLYHPKKGFIPVTDAPYNARSAFGLLLGESNYSASARNVFEARNGADIFFNTGSLDLVKHGPIINSAEYYGEQMIVPLSYAKYNFDQLFNARHAANPLTGAVIPAKSEINRQLSLFIAEASKILESHGELPAVFKYLRDASSFTGDLAEYDTAALYIIANKLFSKIDFKLRRIRGADVAQELMQLSRNMFAGGQGVNVELFNAVKNGSLKQQGYQPSLFLGTLYDKRKALFESADEFHSTLFDSGLFPRGMDNYAIDQVTGLPKSFIGSPGYIEVEEFVNQMRVLYDSAIANGVDPFPYMDHLGTSAGNSYALKTKLSRDTIAKNNPDKFVEELRKLHKEFYTSGLQEYDAWFYLENAHLFGLEKSDFVFEDELVKKVPPGTVETPRPSKLPDVGSAVDEATAPPLGPYTPPPPKKLVFADALLEERVRNQHALSKLREELLGNYHQRQAMVINSVFDQSPVEFLKFLVKDTPGMVLVDPRSGFSDELGQALSDKLLAFAQKAQSDPEFNKYVSLKVIDTNYLRTGENIVKSDLNFASGTAARINEPNHSKVFVFIVSDDYYTTNFPKYKDLSSALRPVFDAPELGRRLPQADRFTKHLVGFEDFVFNRAQGRFFTDSLLDENITRNAANFIITHNPELSNSLPLTRYQQNGFFGYNHFNTMVLGSADFQRVFDPYYSTDTLKSYTRMYNTVAAQEHVADTFLATYFSQDSLLAFNNFFDSTKYSNFEIAKFARDNPQYVGVYIDFADGGYKAKTLTFRSSRTVEAARAFNPIILDALDASRLVNVMKNNQIPKSITMQVLRNISSTVKAGFLSSPGWVMRNIISSISKSLFSSDIGLAELPQRMNAMWQHFKEFNDLERTYKELHAYGLAKFDELQVRPGSAAWVDFFSRPGMAEKETAFRDYLRWQSFGPTSMTAVELKALQDSGIVQGLKLGDSFKNRDARFVKDYLGTNYLVDFEDPVSLELFVRRYMPDAIDASGNVKLDVVNPQTLYSKILKEEFGKNRLAYYAYRGSENAKDMAWKNPYTRNLANANTHVESYLRYDTYRWEIERGEGFYGASQKVKEIHFDYANVAKPIAVADMFLPFLNFKIANSLYWLEMMTEHPAIMRSYIGVVKNNGLFDLSREQLEYEHGLVNLLASGGMEVPFLDDTYIKFNFDFIDAFKVMLSPIEEIKSSTLGLKTVLAISDMNEQKAKRAKAYYEEVAIEQLNPIDEEREHNLAEMRKYFLENEKYINNNIMKTALYATPFLGAMAQRLEGVVKAAGGFDDGLEEADGPMAVADQILYNLYKTAPQLFPSIFYNRKQMYYFSYGNRNMRTNDFEKFLKVMQLSAEDIASKRYRRSPLHKDVLSRGFQVHYIDVGQGDATFIITDSGTVLIDAGTEEGGQKVVEYLKKLGVTSIDYVIATHGDFDHIGGMPTVFEAFTVRNFVSSSAFINQAAYNNFSPSVLSAVSAQGTNMISARTGDEFMVGQGRVTVLAPSVFASDDNAGSVVINMQYKDLSTLFMGDAEEDAEQRMLDLGLAMNSDILKVGHHGTPNATTAEFLEAVDPKYGVISVGAGNPYYHPNPETLQRLEDAGVEVLRTDLLGDVVLGSDGGAFKTNFDDFDFKYIGDKVLKESGLLEQRIRKKKKEDGTWTETPYGADLGFAGLSRDVEEVKKYYCYKSAVTGNVVYTSSLDKLTNVLNKGATPINEEAKTVAESLDMHNGMFKIPRGIPKLKFSKPQVNDVVSMPSIGGISRGPIKSTLTNVHSTRQKMHKPAMPSGYIRKTSSVKSSSMNRLRRNSVDNRRKVGAGVRYRYPTFRRR